MTLAEIERTNRAETQEAAQLRDDFWTNVEYYRKAQGLSVKDIKEGSNIRSSYSLIRGARRMSPNMIAGLSQVLGIPVALLMDQTAAATRRQED